MWDEVVEWARVTDAADGEGKVIDQPWVQIDIARTHAQLEAMKLLNWRLTAALASEELQPADASAAKVYGTETLVDVYRTLLGVVGPTGLLRPGSAGAALRGDLEWGGRSAQIDTFGGGVNEVQREIVAAAGLGMTRSAR